MVQYAFDDSRSLLGNRSETETPLRALWIDASGDHYAGGELGLFFHRTAHDRFYILLDETVDEADDDWLVLDLTTGSLPDPTTIFLPPVHAVMHGPDTHIWLATAQGIARYRAREQRRTYSTLLEAMPQLTGCDPGLDARRAVDATTCRTRGTVIAQVTALDGSDLDLGDPNTRPWVDFVTVWGTLKAAPGFTSRGGAGDQTLSVRVDSEGIAQVLIRSARAEAFAEEEELEVEGFLATRPQAGNFTSIFNQRWREYRATVMAFLKPDATPPHQRRRPSLGVDPSHLP